MTPKKPRREGRETTQYQADRGLKYQSDRVKPKGKGGVQGKEEDQNQEDQNQEDQNQEDQEDQEDPKYHQKENCFHFDIKYRTIPRIEVRRMKYARTVI